MAVHLTSSPVATALTAPTPRPPLMATTLGLLLCNEYPMPCTNLQTSGWSEVAAPAAPASDLAEWGWLGRDAQLKLVPNDGLRERDQVSRVGGEDRHEARARGHNTAWTSGDRQVSRLGAIGEGCGTVHCQRRVGHGEQPR